MFYNNRVSVSSQDETRTITKIYDNIKAQTYKKTVKNDSSIAENTSKEVIIVLLESDKTNVRVWNFIDYIDKFWITKRLKVSWVDYIDTIYFKNLIQLQCDLV